MKASRLTETRSSRSRGSRRRARAIGDVCRKHGSAARLNALENENAKFKNLPAAC
jgi:hypothetical protein